MKKIFTLLAITLTLALPIVSCSADDVSAKQAQTDRESLEIPNDENNSSVPYNQLALYVSKTIAPRGTMISFTTMLNGVDVTNQVTYYANNLAIEGSSIASVFPGTFQIKAKLAGFTDSQTINVTFN